MLQRHVAGRYQGSLPVRPFVISASSALRSPHYALAILDIKSAISGTVDRDIVGGNYEGGASGLPHVADQVQQGAAIRSIQIARRLVQDHDGTGSGQRAGDGDALLFAARELVRKTLRSAYQGAARPSPPLPEGHSF
jgi:hypothetical protein